MGEPPAVTSDLLGRVIEHGWAIDFGMWGREYLGDFLLGMAIFRGVSEAVKLATGKAPEIFYKGERTRLMDRCTMDLRTEYKSGPPVVLTTDRTPVRATVGAPFRPRWPEVSAPADTFSVPVQPPIWLDETDRDSVEVHSALPMRLYLDLEQLFGMRLPANQSPAPNFLSHEIPKDPHIVFVATTSMNEGKQYGYDSFADLARQLLASSEVDFRFTVVTSDDGLEAKAAFERLPASVEAGIDSSDCVDLFSSATVVVGNDTGLTHLAALTTRPNGEGPEVIGLYSRHSYYKWITGSSRHHAVATALAQVLALSDGNLRLDGGHVSLWGDGAKLSAIPTKFVAECARSVADW
jgi:hypothetical protein